MSSTKNAFKNAKSLLRFLSVSPKYLKSEKILHVASGNFLQLFMPFCNFLQNRIENILFAYYVTDCCYNCQNDCIKKVTIGKFRNFRNFFDCVLTAISKRQKISYAQATFLLPLVTIFLLSTVRVLFIFFSNRIFFSENFS